MVGTSPRDLDRLGDWLIRFERALAAMLALPFLLLAFLVADGSKRQIASLLPTVACGQVTDPELDHVLRALLTGTTCLSLAVILLVTLWIWRGRAGRLLAPLAFASAVTHVAAAAVFALNRDHLTECDTFFGGPLVMPGNLGLAIVLSAIAVLSLLTRSRSHALTR